MLRAGVGEQQGFVKRGLREVAAFRMPGQTNRLALVFDPLTDNVRAADAPPSISCLMLNGFAQTCASPQYMRPSSIKQNTEYRSLHAHAAQVPFTFGVEIFEPGHRTTPHTHPSSQELFFILAGNNLALHLHHRALWLLG